MNRQPLQPSDEIRIVAPSMGWQKKREANYVRAKKLLEDKGFKVTFGKHIRDVERFGTGTVAKRAQNLNDAYADKNVKAIMALHGGWSANALLPEIDWELVRQNPKPLIGFSDNTVLVNAAYAMAGGINYLGPNFSGLGHPKGRAYTAENLFKVLMGSEELDLRRSKWWERVEGRRLVPTRPWQVLQPGSASGTLLGGNIGSFYLLQGTPYQPKFDRPIILAIEDDDESGRTTAREFSRRLSSLLQLPSARQNIVGLLVGRFQPTSGVSLPDLRYILEQMALDVPTIIDMDFGHTTPMLTLPIGGKALIETENNQAKVKLVEY